MNDKRAGRVGVELEAAEALAALSWKEGGNFAEDESWTTKHDCSEVPRKDINTISSMAMRSERTEQEFNRMSYRVQGSSSCIKSRNRLTEAEREIRKIRRVLANRESARRTIRRRQAMYDQLTKNAAVLAMENENLKTEKEQALIKFSSLKSMNERLKDMLDKAKAEAIRAQSGDPDFAPINPSNSSTTPALFGGHPFFWLPYVHASDAIPSPVVPSLVTHAHSEQGMHKSSVMVNPVYVLPFPWFFPFQMPQFIAQSSEPSIQYLQRGDIQNQASMNVLCSAGSSSHAEGHMETHHASNAAKMNSMIPYLTMSTIEDCGFGVAADGTGKQTADTMPLNGTSYCARASVSPFPCHTQQEDDEVEMEAVSPSRWSLKTKSEVPIPCPSKKSAGAAATTEARKRRKELTKLKTLYYRHHGMH
ncbi:hypothetical protein LIER_29993 [Lithospermum erythrorhizon]|uniref:BZIP domain-containing protein n=1 Tax=Lithospermum erythrorhizon TaxID=34254 RepID=A0AAV3RMN6_LITER